jgi:hypothetical protein
VKKLNTDYPFKSNEVIWKCSTSQIKKVRGPLVAHPCYIETCIELKRKKNYSNATSSYLIILSVKYVYVYACIRTVHKYEIRDYLRIINTFIWTWFVVVLDWNIWYTWTWYSFGKQIDVEKALLLSSPFLVSLLCPIVFHIFLKHIHMMHYYSVRNIYTKNNKSETSTFFFLRKI